MRAALALIVALLVPCASCAAQEVPGRPPSPPATTQANVGRFPFLEIDARNKVVRVECEALAVDDPLEFFCCVAGTLEHESVLRSKVRPSHLHAALLMLGLEPGEPVRFSDALNKWLPPHGPPLQISVEFEKDGKLVRLPAYRLMRDIRTRRPMPPMTWIFVGSRIILDDVYAADRTGYIVSVVNFDGTVIDIPELASNANETLTWEADLDLLPPRGSKVTMIIEPAGKVVEPAAAIQPGAQAPIDIALIAIDAAGAITFDWRDVASVDQLGKLLRREDNSFRRARVAVANPIEQNPTAREVINTLARLGVPFTVVPQATAGILPAGARPAARPPAEAAAAPAAPAAAEIRVDQAHLDELRRKWQQAVAPHDAALREAAATHYDVIARLRREQQRLINEADSIQRLIDELEKQYQDMTTPRPAE